MASVVFPRNETIKVKPVSIRDVKIEGFFNPYLERNREKSIPLMYGLFKKHGTVENFKIAAGISKKEITRRLATDSDLYKWLEAISWDLQNYPDKRKEKFLDKMIDLVRKTQEPSGYIDTYYTGSFKKYRFKFLENSHELYCGGHLIQSAIAHYRSTGKEKFLDIAIKWANYITKKYDNGELSVNDGHPEVEMALVELYRTTNNKKYLELAGKLMEMPYTHLGNKCFLEMNEVMGHAVRIMYLLCGATDYYLETKREDYYERIRLLEEDFFSGKYYITGGIGSRYQHEAIGLKFELPNLMAYSETCASISLMMWLYRMFFVRQDVKYFNLFERVLYNAFLAAISLKGTEYFYVNPLASTGDHFRKQWYDCTCCPPNFQRFMASLASYFYATGNDEIWINLYDKSRARITLENRETVLINMETDYPWDGNVKIDVKKKGNEKIKIHLRIPDWSSITRIKFKDRVFTVEESCYFTLEIIDDCSFEMFFDIKPELYCGNPSIESDRNCVAICRGPLVYCLEGCDNNFDIFNLFIPSQSFEEGTDKNFHGIIRISGYGMLNRDTNFLYRKGIPEYQFNKVKFNAIPYFSWANRKPSSMIIWVNNYENKKRRSNEDTG
ncbi:MAG: glycoside hydrolase family 127 protein [bacterium]|nr:glycoside hydrolase family 127 protein [bacterium]